MTGRQPDPPLRLPVEDASQVPLARSLAVRAAARAGLTPAEGETVALVTTELAENLHRHAVGGELLVLPGRGQPDVGRPGRVRPALWVVATDRGPGVDRFSRCLVDGYSTAGTLGTGLGAVVRLSTAFDAVSEPGVGTVVAAGFGGAHPDGGHPDGTDGTDGTDGAGTGTQGGALDVAALGFPIDGEDVNGDGWAVVQQGLRVLLVAADGLGHGPGAAAASAVVAAAVPALAHLEPLPLLVELNTRLAGTRGAAVTVAGVDAGAVLHGGPVTGVGLGNVSMLVAGPDGSTRRAATSHGTAGASPSASPRPHVQHLPAGGAVVLHSDGLTTRWDFSGRAELLRHSALVVAAALLRDHSRGRDDTLVVVLKAARGARA